MITLTKNCWSRLRPRSQPESRAYHYWFWLVLGLGTALRLATLERQSLWLDEGYSYWIANRSWSDLLALLAAFDSHPPLYYLIVQQMIALGGSEWLLRLPSALASIVCIGLIFALGEELFDRTTGLVAAFIVAISPIQIWFAQEARMYALVSALSLAAFLFLARALRTNRTRLWLLFGVCEGLALLTDVGAIWLVLAVNIAWLLELKKHWRGRRFWPWLAAQSLALLIYLPWSPSFLRQLSNGATDWIQPATLMTLAQAVTSFIGSYEQEGPLDSKSILALLIVVLAAGALSLARDALAKRTVYLLLACSFGLPIGLAFLISQPYVRLPLLSAFLRPGHSVFLTRNLIVASFPLYLLLARSLVLASDSVMARRLFLPAVLVFLSGIAGASYYQNVLLESKEDYRAAAEIIRSQATPNDVIVFVPQFIKAPFAYYYDRPSANTSFDDLINGVIGQSALPGDASFKMLSEDHRREWLVTNPADANPTDISNAESVLETAGTLLYSKQLKLISVSLYGLNGAR